MSDATTGGSPRGRGSGGAARVHLLGIRHHGPGSARSLVMALDELAPAVVLVELPADVDPVLRWVADPGLVPPVALLGWVVAEPQRSAFVPFAEFSPEWQAIRWARSRGVRVVPIDLPLATTLAADHDDPVLSPPSGIDEPAADPLRALASAAGEPDAERWWEDVVEHRGDGLATFRAVADAMREVRDGWIAPESELRREAHMRRKIRAAQRSEPGGVGPDIAVVCGAWHVPALDVASIPASADAARLRGLRRVTTSVAWVPWTDRRLARRAGYGAGVESPSWYRHVFTHPGDAGIASFYVDAARLLRRSGVDASPDHLIASTRLATSLAALRGRPRAGIGEVLDAADAVMGGLDLIRDHLVVGRSIGEVPAGSPQVPLARDLLLRQRAARLKPTADTTSLELDLRTPLGRRRSRLLHQLLALGVGWGTEEGGRGSSGSFRETWSLRWDPEYSVTLVERSSLGTTVLAAAVEHLRERASGAGTLEELVAVLELALRAGLSDVIDPVVRQLEVHAAHDPDVGELMDSLGGLADAIRYGDVRETASTALRAVFDGFVARIVGGLPVLAVAVDDVAATELSDRLSATSAALAVVEHPARSTSFVRVLEVLVDQRGGAGIVQGRTTRLLHDLGAWPADLVERRLARALSPGSPPPAGAGFVEGFLAGSGVVLVHDLALLGVVDRWLSTLSADTFVEVVPLLRRTFGAFHPAERRQLLQLVTHRPERSARAASGLDADRAAGALTTVRRLLGLPVPEGGR